MKKAISCLATCAILLIALAGCSFFSPTVSKPAGSKSAMQEATDFAASSSSAENTGQATTNNSGSSAAAITNADSLERVRADIDSIAASTGMDVSVSVLDLTTGGYAEYSGSKQMVSASLINLVIAYSFLEQVQAGAHSLEEVYTLQESDIVGGAGAIGTMAPGTQLTYGEILSRTIYANDNTGANILINAVGGMVEVNGTARELGLHATQLNRYQMDEAAMGMNIENYTSADDVVMLLRKAYAGEFVSPEYSAVIMQALRGQEDRAGVLVGLPEGTPFSHVSGGLPMARCDGGIVECAHPYIVVVLCGDPDYSEAVALDVQARIGAATYADIVG